MHGKAGLIESIANRSERNMPEEFPKGSSSGQWTDGTDAGVSMADEYKFSFDNPLLVVADPAPWKL